MNIKEEIKNRIIELTETGTSEGVRKGWESRKRGQPKRKPMEMRLNSLLGQIRAKSAELRGTAAGTFHPATYLGRMQRRLIYRQASLATKLRKLGHKQY